MNEDDEEYEEEEDNEDEGSYYETGEEDWLTDKEVTYASLCNRRLLETSGPWIASGLCKLNQGW